MATYLRISTENIDDKQAVDLRNLEQELMRSPALTIANPNTIRATEIIVALGTAGAFTALYKVVSEYLKKNNSKKLVIERTVKGKSTKFVFDGFNTNEISDLLKMLPPELKGE